MMTPPRRERRRGARRPGGGTRIGVDRSLSCAGTQPLRPRLGQAAAGPGVLRQQKGRPPPYRFSLQPGDAGPSSGQWLPLHSSALPELLRMTLACGKLDKSLQKRQCTSARAGPVQVDGQSVADGPCLRLGLRPSGRDDRRGQRSIEARVPDLGSSGRIPPLEDPHRARQARGLAWPRAALAVASEPPEKSLTRCLAAQSAISTYRENLRKLSVHFYTTAGSESPVNAPTALHLCEFQVMPVVASCGNGDDKALGRLSSPLGQQSGRSEKTTWLRCTVVGSPQGFTHKSRSARYRG